MSARRQPTASRPATLWLLVAALGVLACGGLWGAGLLLSDPSGVTIGMVDVLRQLPVRSFVLPGVLLLVLMGALPLLLIYGLLARPRWPWLQRWCARTGRHWSWLGTLALGLGLLVWLGVQVAYIGFTAPPQRFTAALAVAIVALTLAPATRRAL